MEKEKKNSVQSGCVCELEREKRESVSIKLKPDREICLSQCAAPSVYIEHRCEGGENSRKYDVVYNNGDHALLNFEVSFKGGKIAIDYKTHFPSTEDYERNRYDPFHEGVTMLNVTYPPNISYNGNEAIVRPNDLGALGSIFAEVDLVNLFSISQRGILFNNQIFVPFARDGSLMAPVDKKLRRE